MSHSTASSLQINKTQPVEQIWYSWVKISRKVFLLHWFRPAVHLLWWDLFPALLKTLVLTDCPGNRVSTEPARTDGHSLWTLPWYPAVHSEGASEHDTGFFTAMARILFSLSAFWNPCNFSTQKFFWQQVSQFHYTFLFLWDETGTQIITRPNIITRTKPKSILPFLEGPLRLGFKHLT